MGGLLANYLCRRNETVVAGSPGRPGGFWTAITAIRRLELAQEERPRGLSVIRGPDR